MKKHLFSLLIVPLFAATVSAQTYKPVPFPMDSTIWTEFDEYGKQTHFKVTDTKFIYNNLEYKEVKVASNCNFENVNTMGWIREKDRKVYFLSRYGEKGYKEKLLYDFNLKAGDNFTREFVSIPFATNPPPYENKIETVIKIDTVILDNKLRKRIFFKDFMNTPWIEGIGSLNSLLTPLPIYYSQIIGLSSMIQNNKLVYSNLNVPDCILENYKNTLRSMTLSDIGWSTQHIGNQSTFTHHYADPEIFEYKHYIYNKLYEVEGCDFANGKKWIGGIRETQGKVYYLPIENTSTSNAAGFNTIRKEYLLYDFTLKDDDYIYVDSDINNESKVQVTAVDSVWMGNVKRKRIHLDTPGLDIWIEGIGSTHGLLNNYTFDRETDQSDRLNFAGKPGVSLYENPSINSNDCLIGHFMKYYSPMMKDNKAWMMYHYEDALRNCYTNKYVCSPQDTIIQEKNYKKFYSYWHEGTMQMYLGAMRENGRKVYFIKPSEEAESVLYDFSLNEGDIFQYKTDWYMQSMQRRCYSPQPLKNLKNNDENYIDVRIDYVSTEIINGTPRKVLYTEFGNRLIEGIGSPDDLLNPIFPIPVCIRYEYSYLGLVVENGVTIYAANPIYTDIENQESKAHYTLRSVNSEIIIDFPVGTFDQVDVVNMSAKTIDSKRTNGLEQVTFSTGKYESGVYLFLLQGKDRREVARVVITH